MTKSILRAMLCLAACLQVAAAAPGNDERGLRVRVRAPDAKTPVGEQHLFIIAIDKYQEWSPLRGPVAEAEKLREVLLRRYAFEPDHTVHLKDEQATKGAIISRLRAYKSELGPHDSLLVLFCGHGHLDKDAKVGFWIPVDGGRDVDVQERWLPNSVIRAFLRAMKSRHVLVVADSCFSGDLLNTSRALSATIDNEYYRNAYQRVSRQVMSSGASETVRDASAFGDALYRELDGNAEPYIDPLRLFSNVRLAVKGQTPLLGSLNGAGHQDGASYLFFLRPEPVRRQVASKDPAALPELDEPEQVVQFGEIKLTSHLAGTLYLDGTKLRDVKSGYRYPIRKVTTGQHVLRIACTEGEDWTEPVNVPANGTMEVETPAPAAAQPSTINHQPFVPPTIPHPPSSDPTAGNVLGMAFVEVPAGSFRMGSNEKDEKPVHEVRISKRFWLGKYEVMQSEYEQLMGSNPSNFKGTRNPVEKVSWTDAVAFCRKLTERERAAGRLPSGYEYRLPTEAEWEYAARGGPNSRGSTYSGSNELGEVGWYTDNSGRKTHAVAEKKANELGIHDMSGNVFEWCLDWYGNYPNGVATDPCGAQAGSYRVFRGGGWYFSARLCRVAYRLYGTPSYTRNRLGFRVALGPSQ